MSAESDSLVVRVSDNGRGVPTDKLDSIFLAFSQVDDHRSFSSGGVGIGLFLVKSIVVAHGGSVGVESEGDGRGSTFTVVLPMVEASAR